jgi:hypothetical protein
MYVSSGRTFLYAPNRHHVAHRQAQATPQQDKAPSRRLCAYQTVQNWNEVGNIYCHNTCGEGVVGAESGFYKTKIFLKILNVLQKDFNSLKLHNYY